MSLIIHSKAISYTDIEGDGNLICFPALSQKKIKDTDYQYIKDAYARNPSADYYKEHSLGKRGTLGTISIQGPIINFFVKTYLKDDCVYPNDNVTCRREHIRTCLNELCKKYVKTIHLQLPVSDEHVADFKILLEDFISSYKLKNKKDVTVNLYTCTSTVKPKIQRLVITGNVDDIEELSEDSLFEYRVKRKGLAAQFPEDSPYDYIINDSIIEAELKKITKSVTKTPYFPKPDEVFNAFTLCKDCKVVIVGQDPYHTPGKAHGLAFSVNKNVTIPPSLKTIYKAIKNTCDFEPPKHGCLTPWAERGVLLLNMALTVEPKKAGSHLDLWEIFTQRVIHLLSSEKENIVFVLWGSRSRKLKGHIKNKKNHCILEFNHPSPMVRNNTFDTECTHFRDINDYLEDHGIGKIDWTL